MALTDKEVGDYVVKAFADLRPGPRKAILDALLALRDYSASLDARIAALEGAVQLTDSDGNPIAVNLVNGQYVLQVSGELIEARQRRTNELLEQILEALERRA